MTRSAVDAVAGGAVLGLSLLLFTQVLPGQFEDVPFARNPLDFPRFLVTLMALGGALLLARGIASGRCPGAGPGVEWRRAAVLATMTAAYLAAFASAGFVPATAVFLPAVMVVLGFRRPVAIALVTVGTIAVLWFAFAEIFVIRPPGPGFDTLWRLLVSA